MPNSNELFGDPQPPGEPTPDISRRILLSHGIVGRASTLLARHLDESTWGIYVRGLLSIQRPPGYKSDFDILADRSMRLALKGRFEPRTPDFTTTEELSAASNSFQGFVTHPEGDHLWMNREHWYNAMKSFGVSRKTPHILKVF